MKINTLHELYIDQLRDLHSAETQLIAALPKMEEAATCKDLKAGIKLHLGQTKEQLSRLTQIFTWLKENPAGELCDATAGLIKEGEKAMKHVTAGPVRDAALIGAAQRIEHYEMAAYGTVVSFATLLGFEDQASMLQETLNEETKTNSVLGELAKTKTNSDALKEMTTMGAK